MSGGGDYDEIAAKYTGAVDIELAAHEAVLTGQCYPWIPDGSPVRRNSYDDARDSRAGEHFAGNEAATTLSITLIAGSRYVDFIIESADIGELRPCSVGGNQFKVIGDAAGGKVYGGYELVRGLVIIDANLTVKAAADLNECGHQWQGAYIGRQNHRLV